MKNPKVFIMTLLCLIVMVACQHDDPVNPLSDGYLSWNAFYEKYGVKPQTFKVDAETGGTFEAEEGMILIIPPNAIVNKFGRKVSGEVTVEFCEFLSLKDMFLSGLNTMGDRQFLVSGGSFKIELEQNGEVLEIAHADGARVIIPPVMKVGKFADKMFPFIWTNSLWQGDTTSSWTLLQDIIVPRDPAFDNAFNMAFNGRGLFNCDVYYNWFAGANTTFTDFKVSARGADISHSRVVLMLKEFSSLVELTVIDGESKLTYNSSIPVGVEGRLIVVSMEDKKLKYGYQDIKIAGKELFEVEVATGTADELKALLDNPF